MAAGGDHLASLFVDRAPRLADAAARRRDDARGRPLGDRRARRAGPRADGARGRGRRARRRAHRPRRARDGGLRQGQQRRRRARRRAAAARGAAARSRSSASAPPRGAHGRRAREPRAPARGAAAAARRQRRGSGRRRSPGRTRAPLAPRRRSAAVVDALLGTGFEGEPRGAVAEAIEAINASARAGRQRGRAERRGRLQRRGRRARRARDRDRRRFHAAKPGLWINPGKATRASVETIDIGIPRGAPMRRDDRPDRRRRCSRSCRAGSASWTKFKSGQVLVAGGSRGLTGAPHDGRAREHARGRRLRDRVRARLAAAAPRGRAARPR